MKSERLTAAAAGAMTWLTGVVLTLTVMFPLPDQRGSFRGDGELMLAAVIGLAGASWRGSDGKQPARSREPRVR